MQINTQYYDGTADDDLPYTGVINNDPETGFFYDEDGDAVDLETVASFCQGGGEGGE